MRTCIRDHPVIAPSYALQRVPDPGCRDRWPDRQRVLGSGHNCCLRPAVVAAHGRAGSHQGAVFWRVRRSLVCPMRPPTPTRSPPCRTARRWAWGACKGGRPTCLCLAACSSLTEGFHTGGAGFHPYSDTLGKLLRKQLPPGSTVAVTEEVCSPLPSNTNSRTRRSGNDSPLRCSQPSLQGSGPPAVGLPPHPTQPSPAAPTARCRASAASRWQARCSVRAPCRAGCCRR
jgi:hypothetical protein